MDSETLQKYLAASSGQLPPQSTILDLIGFLDLPSEHLERKSRKKDSFFKACNFNKTWNSKIFKDFAATFGTLDFTGKRLRGN